MKSLDIIFGTSGNKEEDYRKSNLTYEKKEEKYNYKVVCKKCGAEMYRKRLKKDLVKNYRCAKCGGKLNVFDIT